MWLSLRLCHCLCCHNYYSIKYGKYHHVWSDPSAPHSSTVTVTAVHIRWISQRRNTAVLWQNVAALEHNAHSDTKADIGRPIWQICNVTLHCTRVERYIWSALHWATDLTDMARRCPGREMVGHGRRNGEKILFHLGHKLWEAFSSSEKTLSWLFSNSVDLSNDPVALVLTCRYKYHLRQKGRKF